MMMWVTPTAIYRSICCRISAEISSEHPPTLVLERTPCRLRIIREGHLQQHGLLNRLRVTSDLAAMLGQHGDFPLKDLRRTKRVPDIRVSRDNV